MRDWFQALSIYQHLPAWIPADPEPARRPGFDRARARSVMRTVNRLLWPWVRGYRRRRRALVRVS